LTVSNNVALKWATEAGRIYKVQSRGDLTSGSWTDTTGELSATKTNSAMLFYAGGINTQFHRIVQIR